MASSIALLRGATTSRLLSKFVRRASASGSGAFNTKAQVSNVGGDGGGDRSVDVERRPDHSVSSRRDTSPSFFSDVFDPFSPPRSLSQMLNFMDQFMDNPFFSRGIISPSRRGWDVKEDDNTLLLRMDMPGLSKNDVKISVHQNTLIIKGEAAKESEDDGGDEDSTGTRRYSSRIDLPPNLYKVDEIKAEMKNGVLKVLVPKVKEQESKDVFPVQVE